MARFGAGDNYGTDASDIFLGNDSGKNPNGGKIDDIFYAGDGNDYVHGLAGNDLLSGDVGNDVVTGGLGSDTLYGGWLEADNRDNNDENGNDTLAGGSGNDLIYGNGGNDYLYGEQDNDTMYGGAGNDSLNGGDGNDNLYGGADNDYIFAGKGNDSVDGGLGNDILSGTLSHNDVEIDVFTGGAGNDLFVVGDSDGNSYRSTGDADYAHIKDLQAGDQIQVDSGKYEFDSSPIAGISGTGIYHNSDLIAVVEGIEADELIFSNQGSVTNIYFEFTAFDLGYADSLVNGGIEATAFNDAIANTTYAIDFE